MTALGCPFSLLGPLFSLSYEFSRGLGGVEEEEVCVCVCVCVWVYVWNGGEGGLE